MNKKILKILEFGEITKRLSELAITEPAKKEAERLVPSDDFDQVQTELKQTLALADLLRIKVLLSARPQHGLLTCEVTNFYFNLNNPFS